MPTPDTLDFAKLLEPIAGDNPAGDDLRAAAGPGSPYYQVKDARNAARAAERKMEGGDPDAPPADWKPVVQAATAALATRTKDLELVAYLIEAEARVNGFAGLRDGFRLARELCDRFWDGLYPAPDEDGLATRVAPVAGLNGDDSEGTLIAPINRVPFTASATHGRLTYSNYVQAAATARITDPKVKEKRIADGAMSMEKVQKAVDETPTPVCVAFADDLAGCLDEFAKLNAVLGDKCGPAAPPASAIRTALTNIQDAFKDVARNKLAVAMPAAPPPEADGSPAAGPAAAGGKGAGDDPGPGERLGVIRTRDDALNALLRVADYFRRTEPHTVLSYTLEQVVRWGRMTLPELMAELIGDDAVRKAMFKQVGIAEPAGGDDEGDGGKAKKKR